MPPIQHAPIQQPPIQQAAPAPRRSRFGLVIIFLSVGFLFGIIAAIALLPNGLRWWNGAPAAVQTLAAPASVQPLPATRPADAARQDLLAARMGELEERMLRIGVEAQAAAGYAGRSEGMLVAFAARRDLDEGVPLGYVEGQLRLRFGQAQPRAVATIINAAREPVTLLDLQAGLQDISPKLRVNPPGTSWWTAVERELRELIVIRKATQPSLEPDMALPRIRRLLAAGRVEPAIAEVERLPGRAAADRWLQVARRYREARRALDLIETAAILEQRPILAPTAAASLPAARSARPDAAETDASAP